MTGLLAAIRDAAQQFVDKHIAALQEVATLVRRIGARRRPSALDRERLSALWFEGSVRFATPLAPTPGSPRRGVSLLVQRDGDAVLSLPADIDADPTDRQRARDAVAEAKAAMHAMWAAGPAAWIALTQLAVELLALAGAVSWYSWSLDVWRSAALGDVTTWAKPIAYTVLPIALWPILGRLARWLGSWLLNREIGKLRPSS